MPRLKLVAMTSLVYTLLLSVSLGKIMSVITTESGLQIEEIKVG